MILRLVKGLIMFTFYIFLRLLHLYSYLCKSALRGLELVYIIPFKWIFLCRLGDAYTIESAFLRRYYASCPVYHGSTVIDIGAHIGTYTIRASRKVGKEGYVIAVEPELRNVEYLAINCALNGAGNVRILKVACGRKNGYAHLYLHDFTGHSIKIPSGKSILTKVVSLDTLMSVFGRPSRSEYIIKINAEGAELDILQGSAKTLR